MKKALAIFLIALSSLAFAQVAEVKGVGTIQYDAGVFSGDPSDSDKKKAFENAKMAAWRTYVAKLNPAKQKILFSKEKEVQGNIDRLVTSFSIVDQKVDPQLKTYTVVARVGFNEGAVDQLAESMTVGGTGQASSGMRSKDSLFSFLFMARKATSIRQFDERRTMVREASASTSVSDDGGVTAREEKTVGGSTLRKEDAVSYAVTSSQDIDSQMGEILNTAGVEYAGYDDLVAECKAPTVNSFKNEFVKEDELTPGTRSKVIAAARACDVRYFAYGTIDTGVSDTDPVSGARRVYVSVRSQLWDLSQRLPRKIGSVGPIQYSGLGPDQSVASRNALQTAAKETARALVDQLNAKGVR